jgi:hypothetical protein
MPLQLLLLELALTPNQRYATPSGQSHEIVSADNATRRMTNAIIESQRATTNYNATHSGQSSHGRSVPVAAAHQFTHRGCQRGRSV